MSDISNRKPLRLSIRLTVVGVFAMATLITSAVAISLQYHFSKNIAVKNAVHKYQQAASNTSDFLNALDSSATQATLILSKHSKLVKDNWVDEDVLPLLSEIMAHHRSFYAIYLGFANGNFYEVVNLNSSNTARRQLKASPEDRWLVITVKQEEGQRLRNFHYYDEAFNFRISRSEHIDYDPRVRPWYTNAHKNRVSKTAPYLFQHLQASGQTYSIRLSDDSAVLAVDITHSSLSGHLRARNVSEDSEVFIYQQDGELVASNQSLLEVDHQTFLRPLELPDHLKQFVNQAPTFRVSNEMDWPPIDYAVSGSPQGYSIELLNWIAHMTGLRFEYMNGYSWAELKSLFEDGKLEILQPLFRNKSNDRLGLWSDPFLNLPYAIVTQPNQDPVKFLDQLNHKTVAIPQGWSIINTIRKHYPKIQIVEAGSPKAALNAVIQGQAYATIDSSIILHHITQYYFLVDLQFHEDIQFKVDEFPQQLHFVVQTDYPQLIEIINLALANLTATQKHLLRENWFPSTSQDQRQKSQFTVPYEELIQLTKHPGNFNQLTQQKMGDKNQYTFITPLQNNAGSQEYFAATISSEALMHEVFQSISKSIYVTAAILILFLPICWLFAAPIVRPIKKLAVESDKIRHRQYDQVEIHESHIVELDDLNQSIVNMAKSIQQHELNQRKLMESLIQLIAQAIDDKSPYTAGHCNRVPQLAIMMIKAAEQSNDEPFKDFRFKNEDEFREFRIAAWLHDCGKITTPEHIVDKGTKLETIYNRIHEIRTRFEVLWRDAEIDYLKQLSQTPHNSEQLKSHLDNKRKQLQDDFAFIAALNQGSEFVSDEDLARLNLISTTTWTRYFSDRLGLSPVEKMHLTDAEAALPAVEKLISDKPQHVMPRSDHSESYARLGLKVDIPEQLYNLGEHYNLSVRKGTLTTEDRFKIQEHIISTIKMLDNLPFPEELSRVPRYASTHHETLDGKGYPRKLYANDLSIPERIMALADIFEALTAADRPYKTAKTIGEAIMILEKMVAENHVDKDVFQLFLSSGVYLDYAEQFLDASQINEVNIDLYLKDALSN